MPGFRGHLIGGTVTYLAILQCIKSMQPSIPVIISGFIFCIIGSLFPDIDIKSKGQKLFYSAALFVLCGFLWYERTDNSSVVGKTPRFISSTLVSYFYFYFYRFSYWKFSC